MSYEIYSQDILYPMFFHTFNIKPYVFDKSFSLYEQIGQALEHVNEVIKETNDIGSALTQFETYIINQLATYDIKIQTDVTEILNKYISDGTIANLINTTLLSQINNNITDLQNNLSTHSQENTNKFNQIDQAIETINYKQGSCSINTSPSQILYNVGESINSIIINYSIIKGTNDIGSIKLYKNDLLINTLSNNIQLNGSITDGSIINTDTTFKIVFNDGKQDVESNIININFVNDFYYGVVDNVELNESLIKNLSSIKSLKENLDLIVTPVNKKIVIAYPSIYGDLSSIIDSENYDIINAFSKSIINLTLNSTQVPYNIYCSNNIIYDTNIELNIQF
jgi:hypothetical protein